MMFVLLISFQCCCKTVSIFGIFSKKVKQRFLLFLEFFTLSVLMHSLSSTLLVHQCRPEDRKWGNKRHAPEEIDHLIGYLALHLICLVESCITSQLRVISLLQQLNHFSSEELEFGLGNRIVRGFGLSFILWLTWIWLCPNVFATIFNHAESIAVGHLHVVPGKGFRTYLPLIFYTWFWVSSFELFRGYNFWLHTCYSIFNRCMCSDCDGKRISFIDH